MSESITPWIHIVAVTVWLGPQFFLFIAAVPAVRLIEDEAVRLRVMRVIVNRFSWLAWAAMAVIVLSGISNLFQVADDTTLDLGSTDFRYFHIFTTKMTLVGLIVLLTALHTFVIGPRQLRLQEEMGSDSAEVARLRRLSIIISGLALLASVAVVYVAALLANHEFSFKPT
ncbi:MAG: CopD family protein [Chloroflexi bacterium]|nr:CopD family protein [Chloroflexota bacterium]